MKIRLEMNMAVICVLAAFSKDRWAKQLRLRAKRADTSSFLKKIGSFVIESRQPYSSPKTKWYHLLFASWQKAVRSGVRYLSKNSSDPARRAGIQTKKRPA